MARFKTELKMFLISLFIPFICVYEVIHLVKIYIVVMNTIVVIAKKRNLKIVKVSVKYDYKNDKLIFDVVTKRKEEAKEEVKEEPKKEIKGEINGYFDTIH